ncbi:Alpha-parvin, partial [Fragariocoptes setiger]
MMPIDPSKTIVFFLITTFILSFINVALILYITKSIQLTKHGLAEGHISLQEHGLVFNTLTKLTTSLSSDHVQALDTRPLSLIASDKLTIASGTNSLIADANSVQIVAKNFTLAAHNRVMASLNGPHSVSLTTHTLRPNSVSGYTFSEGLEVSQISGSHNHDLELVSRTGKLSASSAKDMDIVTMVTQVDVSSYESIVMQSSRLSVESRKLRLLGTGVRYFDQISRSPSAATHQNFTKELIMLMSQRNAHANRSFSLSRPHRKPPPQSRAPSPSSTSTLGRYFSRKQSVYSSLQSSATPTSDRTNDTIYAPPSVSAYIRQRQAPRVAPTNKPTRSRSGESNSSGRDSVLGGFFERIGTIRRKNKHKNKDEGEEIYAEGLKAIDGNAIRPVIDLSQDDSMQEGETRTVIEPSSLEQANFKQLQSVLTNWINDELAAQRIIVKELDEDLYDGQILGKLIEKLQGIRLDVVEVTQNENTQKYKLKTVLSAINSILPSNKVRWSVDGIHGKNLVEIIFLLINLAQFYRAPIKLPDNIRLRVTIIQKYGGNLMNRTHEVQITDTYDDKGQRIEHRDVFDVLLQSGPEKLEFVQKSLVRFVNRHLSKINLSCLPGSYYRELDARQFSDGIMLIFLIASLEDYFVPLGNIFMSPSDEAPGDESARGSTSGRQLKTAIEPKNYINTLPIQKLHNVNVAFQLIEDAGIDIRQQVRVEDIVNGDLKSVLRVLHSIYSRYKHL